MLSLSPLNGRSRLGHHRRLAALGLALGVLLALAGLVVPAGVPAAAAASSCPGVAEVVQFPNGHTATGCDPGSPSTGYAALTGAGFSYTVVTGGSGAGALCTINDAPANASCSRMPSANAYWSYWHAQPGGHWQYSSEGGGSYHPQRGSVDGWAFGSGKPPRTPPPGGSRNPPPPKPKPTHKPTPKPSPTATPTHRPRPTHAPAPPHGSGAGTSHRQHHKAGASAAAAGASGRPTSSRSPSPVASATPLAQPAGGSSPVSSGASVGTAPRPHTSSPTAAPSGPGGLSWIWGIAALGVLLVAAGVAALVRRRP